MILYELLAGNRPYRLKHDSRGALEDAILQADPTLPSAMVDKRAAKTLRGDLDTICLEALKKRPQGRYATVHALADDIARYLDGRPVLAQPDSAAYRLRKFIVRNRLPVTAAVGVALAVLIGAGAALWQARVAISERERAEQVKDFIASIMRDADPYKRGSRQIDAVDLLHTARAKIDRELAGQHQVRVELLGIIGESFYGLRENAEAAEVLEQALNEAQALPDSDSGSILRLRRVLSQAYEFLGRSADSRRQLQIVLDAFERSGRRDDPELIEALLHKSLLDYYAAKYPDALEAAEKAQRLGESIPNPPVDAAFEAAELMASVHKAEERVELAVSGYRRAYELALETYANHPRHPRVLWAQMGYANTLALDGRPKEALPYSQAAATAAAEIFGADSVMVGFFLNSLASIQIEVGEIQAAIESSRKSLAIYERTRQRGTRDHSSRLRGLGRELLAARRPGEALQPLAAALDMSVRLEDVRGQRTGAAHYGLALSQLGRFEEAEALLVPIVNADEGRWTRARMLAVWHLGTMRRMQGDAHAALAKLDEALALARERPRSELDRGQMLVEIGRAQFDLTQYMKAIGSLSAARELLEAAQVRPTPDHADALMALGRAHLALGQSQTAVAMLERTDAFWRDFDPENRWSGEAALWLGRCQLALGRKGEADASLNRAERILSRSVAPSDRKLAQVARKS